MKNSVFSVVWIEKENGRNVKKREDFCCDFARRVFIERIAGSDSFVRLVALVDY